ncbi:uroporphyrinogen-III C-methyltransferase [Amphritea sp. 2_MG-2023]|jgi:uroporphyrin-3 C-methyltransferase|uniref:uroporphyrinogen-III C-methyltransferase n=1 Tax=Amphritea TaxID=515417 RepID=UPI001C06D63C|nr:MULTISPECIES: uroporphyrinogen-III C-methyltransferase [Amphritea]MBU2967143.1 uroporphyrinogen-III C-methyltransferase [Amphritea atlantica]MDO6419304.1 uroporphyrinogen-III C-methyltransferase [Amphritea sp. 2_MG-2023]
MKKSGNNNPATSDKPEEVLEGELIEKDSAPADKPDTSKKKASTKPSEDKPSKASDKTADNNEPKASPPEKETPKKAKASWAGRIALLLALLAIAGVAYLYWLQLQSGDQLQQSQQNTTSELNGALTKSQQQFEQQISALSQKLSALENKASQDQSNVNELQKRLTQSIQQVTAAQNNNREDWLLAEVEYLLRLANQRVLMEQTPRGALQLLRSADKILSETDDVTIYEIRKAVAADIAALEAVPELDTEGVFLRLGALSTQVDQLQVIPLTEQHKLPDLLDQMNSEEFASSWSSDIKEAWATLSDKASQLIVIQDRSEPVEPLLSPQQSYYLQQNLHLMLEQAQLSLLQRKPKSYLNSLTKAQQWVGTYFEQNDSNTQALLKALKELEQVDVAPQMPNISGSLAALKNYVKAMRKLKEGAA